MNALQDRIPELHGHWKMEVYEGPEMIRAALTPEQEAQNRLWEAESRKGLPRQFRHKGVLLNPLKDVLEGDNLVTTVGKHLLLERTCGVTGAGAALTSLSVGTSNVAAAVGNTSLTGQVNQVFDSAPTRSLLVVTMVATFAAGTASFAWAEMGAWNGSTLFARIAPIGPYTKGAADIITLTYQLTQG